MSGILHSDPKICFTRLTYFFISRYSGELREIGMQIDDLASFIWENVSYCYIIVTCDPLIMKLKIK